jgi:mannosyltransferase OCH1-like enzyme
MIPNKLHFIWINKDNYDETKIPVKYENNIKTWKDTNPELIIKIWYYNDIVEFIKTNYSEDVLTFFTNLKKVISKCDFARFLIIYKEGGIYSDLDFYSLKNFYEYVKNKDSFLVPEPEEHQRNNTITNICNGLFAFSIEHYFVKGYIDYMMKNSDYKKINTLNDVLSTTGPVALRKYYYESNSNIPLENYCLILPYFSNGVSKKCDIKNAFLYTKWNEGSGWNRRIIYQYVFVFVKVVLFILIIYLVCYVLNKYY